MASRRAEITMSDAELRALLGEVKAFTLGTIGPDGTPHLSAMWFAHVEEVEPGIGIDVRLDVPSVAPACDIVFWTYRRAQKTRNMARDLRITLLFEAGTTYAELRGAMVRGRAHLIDDLDLVTAIGTAVILANDPDMEPDAARRQAGAQSPKRTAVRFEPVGVASWDHRKL
jgi:hypothetical protein